MRQALRHMLMAALASSILACVAMPPGAATVIDRIAASVGSHVITESDVIRDLRVSAFLDQKPLDLSGPEKRKAAGRLVDQYLILHDGEMNHVTLPADADAAPLLERTKAQFATELGYRAALARYGVTEAEVRAQLLAGLRTLRYTDFRFRPEVQLSDQEMRDYYDKLMTQGGGASPAPSFTESRDRVQTLMTDERVIQALDRWLGVVRAENHARFWDAAFQ